jgi:hypothetical protein
MSPQGQTPTFALQNAKSASSLKADIDRVEANVS